MPTRLASINAISPLSVYGDTNPPGVEEDPKAEFRRQGRYCGIVAMRNSREASFVLSDGAQ